jgi:zinc/manganese transport system ATP-binding protein
MVKLDNLTVSYRQHPALHHLSGHFAKGSLTAVFGPNGSGKSTLLKSIVGLLPAADGCATVSVPRKRVAYLAQLPDIDRGYPINVQDCVVLGCWQARGAWWGMTHGDLSRLRGAMQTVGLEGLENRPISTLSSGQLQRVLFARLLVQDADLILLDEPFNAIDEKTTALLLGVVAQWHRQQRTVIAVLHEEMQVRQHFPQTLLLAREAVAWGPTAQTLTEANLARTAAMAEAWDDAAEICRAGARPVWENRIATEKEKAPA